ncbi:radical SAM protein [Burkholderia humptydooensis]|uniref:Radical SAM protein n=2 Tax=Burkholderia humptydooensis TaxID=430531 RepID=A0A7U4P763_9BURK|nr:radical SAM protein [Burkholderia humptydooensis]EIP88640.1 radical SAM domain protein [Burkholderia humptydooensis MSMB43]QPS45607.1 radical SAM protein [Burkholderia humptydooensis]
MAPPAPRKGRGAVGNLQGRYETVERETVDDGWTRDNDGEPPAPLRTQVFEERARTILTRNASPDIPFNVSLNPYRGCEHVMRHSFLFTLVVPLGFDLWISLDRRPLAGATSSVVNL